MTGGRLFGRPSYINENRISVMKRIVALLSTLLVTAMPSIGVPQQPDWPKI